MRGPKGLSSTEGLAQAPSPPAGSPPPHGEVGSSRAENAEPRP